MQTITSSNSYSSVSLTQRDHNLDLIRIVACFMVIMVHVRMYYTYDASGEMFSFSTLYLTAIRPCVPLFIMISGFLLLPLQRNLSDFLKRRMTRVCVPVIVWMILYAFMIFPISLQGWSPVYSFTPGADASYFQNVLYHLCIIPVTFTGETCHFWFLYLIIGLYLFMPIISPWIEKANTQMYLYFLGIWGFTLFIPYIKLAGIEQFHGLCDWNLDFHMTYAFSGYLGYMILGCYLHSIKYKSRKNGLFIGLGLFLLGWLFTALMVHFYASTNKDTVLFELFIGNTTPNVALMTAGLFITMQNVNIKPLFYRFLARLSILSFGIFLIHWVIAMWCVVGFKHLQEWADIALAPFIGLPVLAISVFCISWGITEIINLLPNKIKHCFLG